MKKNIMKDIKARIPPIAVLFLLVAVAFNTIFVLLPGDSVKGASVGDFDNYKTITIDHDLVDATLTNFPVWVYNVSSDFMLDETSFSFFDVSNDELYWELDYFDYATGTIGCWVNITSISSSVDTDFFIYFDDANSSDGGENSPDDVWNSDYEAVFHFDQSAGSVLDSTSNNNDGTNDGAVRTSGLYGYGYDFEEGDAGDDVDIGDIGIDTSGEFTFMALMKTEEIDTDAQVMIGVNDGSTKEFIWFLRDPEGDEDLNTLYNYNGTEYSYGNVIVDENWHMLAIAVDGTDVDNYVNKSFYDGEDFTVSLSPTGEEWHIGDRIDDTGSEFDGIIDELWISSVQLTRDWINATFETITNPDGFLSFSASSSTSDFNLYGLDTNKITWSGVADSTVWSNETNPGGTLNITMVIPGADNVTEIRVYVDDLDVDINASNISIQFSSDNTTWGANTQSFSDGGSNITINDSEWTTGNGCYGTDPFAGAGLTDGTFYIYARFTLAIPLGTSADTYSQSDWKVWYKVVT